jgi:hypothetical protein
VPQVTILYIFECNISAWDTKELTSTTMKLELDAAAIVSKATMLRTGLDQLSPQCIEKGKQKGLYLKAIATGGARKMVRVCPDKKKQINTILYKIMMDKIQKQ